MTFHGVTVQDLKKVPFSDVFFITLALFLPWLMCTFKGLVYYVKRRKMRHPRTGKRGCVNALSTLHRYCLWTFQLKEILVSTFCPAWNVPHKAVISVWV